jgi:hypothetical protein
LGIVHGREVGNLLAVNGLRVRSRGWGALVGGLGRGRALVGGLDGGTLIGWRDCSLDIVDLLRGRHWNWKRGNWLWRFGFIGATACGGVEVNEGRLVRGGVV